MHPIPQYEIAKLTPREVVMRHRETRAQYLYADLPRHCPPALHHPCILTPMVHDFGLLYPLPATTLAKQIRLLT